MDDPQPPELTTDESSHDTAAEPKPPANRRKYVRIVIAACILIGLALLAIAAAIYMQPKSKTTGATDTQTKAPTSVPSVQPSTSASPTNVWKGQVSPTSIPLGDGHVSTSPQVGYVYSCTTNFRGGGARHAGDWIDVSNNTWSMSSKIAVSGSVHWAAATYSTAVSGTNFVITTNDLPEVYPSGTFPISRQDSAYMYDTNPNFIGAQTLTYTLPLNPTAASTPGCTPLGPIGVTTDGVVLFNALDDAGRDAVAHETQDLCNGHPNGQDMYHYHDIPSCIRDAATGSSTLAGYALDGYGIYVERDASGNLPTNADLDVCHGRTSPVMWHGKLTDIYHYDATLEYPYTVGCFHGTAVTSRG